MSDADRARHPGWRRTTRRYRRKQGIVRGMWIGSGMLMLALPDALPVIVLVTTITAFMILDETR